MKRLSLLFFVFLLSVSSGIAQTERAQSSPRTTPLEVGASAPDFTLEDFRVENDHGARLLFQRPADRRRWCWFFIAAIGDLTVFGS